MSLGYFFDQLLAGGCEFSHDDPLKVFSYTRLYKPQRHADCLIFAILGELPRLENQRYRDSGLDRVVPAITRTGSHCLSATGSKGEYGRSRKPHPDLLGSGIHIKTLYQLPAPTYFTMQKAKPFRGRSTGFCGTSRHTDNDQRPGNGHL
jgi:hypothetical protein